MTLSAAFTTKLFSRICRWRSIRVAKTASSTPLFMMGPSFGVRSQSSWVRVSARRRYIIARLAPALHRRGRRSCVRAALNQSALRRVWHVNALLKIGFVLLVIGAVGLVWAGVFDYLAWEQVI